MAHSKHIKGDRAELIAAEYFISLGYSVHRNMSQHGPVDLVLIDEDGVGGGVKDGISGCKGFVNGSKALKNENFQNLKTQCYFKLAELVNQGKVAVKDKAHKQVIIEELEIIKRDKIDKDTQKLSIIPKDTIKSLLGRSPDYADALMMRMWYEVKGNYGVYAF